MKLLIRTDASEQIGSGHLMRCLTLSEKVKLSGGEVTFICRELPGHRCDFIESLNYKIIRLPFNGNSENISNGLEHASWLSVTQELDASQTLSALKANHLKADWLLIDHYAVDYNWEGRLRPFVSKIMVIDDLADRKHDCDLLLDQNFQHSIEKRYVDLLPDKCISLLGPKFALLRQEFEDLHNSSISRDGRIRRILIFMGGYDLSNETGKALNAVLSLKQTKLVIDLVVGASNKNRGELEAACNNYENVNFHCQVNNIASLMSKADLAIGGGGTTTWERAFLGLPALVIVLAKNQAEFSKAVADHGATINLGWYEDVTESDIAQAVKNLIDDQHRVSEISNQAKNLFGDRELSGVEAVLKEMEVISCKETNTAGRQSVKGRC